MFAERYHIVVEVTGGLIQEVVLQEVVIAASAQYCTYRLVTGAACVDGTCGQERFM